VVVAEGNVCRRRERLPAKGSRFPKGWAANATRPISSSAILFDVEILRIPPAKAPYPYHSHSAQWEFYHVISGSGSVRHQEGTDRVAAGDACIFPPGEPHQFVNDGTEHLVMYVVADNPIGESWYYPDSGKWGVGLPERRLMRSDALDYFDGEE